MIISISGTAGSGKSTVAKLLAKKMGFESFYIGGIRREMARKRGMTLAQYNEYGETHPETDKEADDYQAELGKTKDDFVIQGRVSYHFIPHSIKVFLDVDLDEGARRIWQDMQQNPDKRNEDNVSSQNELKQSLIERQESDNVRYKKYYNLSCYDKSNYDIVINTTDKTAEEVADEIMNHALIKDQK